MEKIDNNYIIMLHEVINDADTNKIYIILEYMQFGCVLSDLFFSKAEYCLGFF